MRTLKLPNMQKVVQMIQKSCSMAFSFMCLPLDSLSCDNAICYSAQPQEPVKSKLEQGSASGPRSTVLIVNISNSTLKDCIIGDTYQPAVADRQPLMQHSEHFGPSQRTCSCSHGQQRAEQVHPPPPPLPPSDAEQLSINIQSSHLNGVIIGDNNYMYVEHQLLE